MIAHWACCPSVSGVMSNTLLLVVSCPTHYLEPMLKTTQVCLFTKRSETPHMYPQMTLPRTVLWNYKVCSLVTKIMPPDLLGENFTPSENGDSPGFPIFHNFESKENLL